MSESPVRVCGAGLLLLVVALVAGWATLGTSPAQAQPTPYTLTATDTPTDGGYVEIAGGVFVREGTKIFVAGDTAVVVALPSEGWDFVRWSGDVTGTTQAQTIVMDGNKTVTAHWEQISPGGSATGTAATNPSVGLPPKSRVLQIDAGEDHTCAVTDSRIAVCWGRNDAGQASASEGTYVAVSAGTDHSCGLSNNGRIECWGSDIHGQFAPQQSTTFIAVSSGERVTCGAYNRSRYDQTEVRCWGDLQSGPDVLGISGGNGGVSVGANHWCVRGGRSSGRGVFCRGINNVYGQSEDLSGGYVEVTSGANHNCVRERDGVAKCWGRNRFGQTAAPSSVRFIDISAGTSHTCGVNSANEIACWGLSSSRQIDSPGGNNWMLVAAGRSHSCAVNEDGKVACWGTNGYGQLNVPAGIAAPATPQRPTSTPQVTQPPTADDDGDAMQGAISVDVRIIARRTADGRVEFGIRMSDGREQFPTARFFPANGPGHGRWLRSSVLDFGHGFRGRIIARYHASDGRTEFGLRINGFPNDMFPEAKYFPASPRPSHNRYLRSSVLSFGN